MLWGHFVQLSGICECTLRFRCINLLTLILHIDFLKHKPISVQTKRYPTKSQKMPLTALFVIDIQNELAGNVETEIPSAARIRAVSEQILAASRGLPDGGSERALTVFVQHEEDPQSGGSLVKGAELWKLVFPPREGVADEILVSKTTRKASSFPAGRLFFISLNESWH